MLPASRRTVLPLVCLLLAGLAGQVRAKDRAVDARLEMSTENPAVGDTIEYRVTVTVTAGWELVVPDSFDFSEGLAPVKEEIRVLKRRLPDSEEQELVVPLVVMRLGRLRIKEKTLVIQGPEGASESITAGRIFVTVGTHFPTESNPQPGAPLCPVPLMERNWLLIWGAGIFAVVALTILLTLLLVRLRPRKAAPAPRPRPAHEVALERLTGLKRKSLDEMEEFEPLYTELSEILRQYLGLRWTFDSLDMTTTELLAAMSRVQLEHFMFQQLESAMMDLDLVKFARVPSAPQKARADIDRVEKLVVATQQTGLPAKSDRGEVQA